MSLAGSRSWKVLLPLGLLAYAIFIGLALASKDSLSPYYTFLAALVISIAVIASLVLKARREIRALLPDPCGPPTDFWLYASMSRKRKLTLIATVPLIITVLEYSVLGRIASVSFTAIIMLCISAVLGLGLPVYVYKQFKDLVENMRHKLAPADTGYAEHRAAMTIFARAAGGAPTYQVVTVLVAISAYTIFAILAFLLQGLFVVRPLPILVSIIIAGIVAPMTTTIAGFVVYCKNVFGEGRHFDMTDSDGQGGFRSLGAMGLTSSSMSAIVAGLGVPVSFFGPGTVTPYEFGLTLFTVFFIALTFVTPILLAHTIIASSKRRSLDGLRNRYRKVLLALDDVQKESSPNGQSKLLRAIYLESTFHRVLKVEEWPSGFTLIWGSANATIPIAVELIGKHFNIFWPEP